MSGILVGSVPTWFTDDQKLKHYLVGLNKDASYPPYIADSFAKLLDADIAKALSPLTSYSKERIATALTQLLEELPALRREIASNGIGLFPLMTALIATSKFMAELDIDIFERDIESACKKQKLDYTRKYYESALEAAEARQDAAQRIKEYILIDHALPYEVYHADLALLGFKDEASAGALSTAFKLYNLLQETRFHAASRFLQSLFTFDHEFQFDSEKLVSITLETLPSLHIISSFRSYCDAVLPVKSEIRKKRGFALLNSLVFSKNSTSDLDTTLATPSQIPASITASRYRDSHRLQIRASYPLFDEKLPKSVINLFKLKIENRVFVFNDSLAGTNELLLTHKENNRPFEGRLTLNFSKEVTIKEIAETPIIHVKPKADKPKDGMFYKRVTDFQFSKKAPDLVFKITPSASADSAPGFILTVASTLIPGTSPFTLEPIKATPEAEFETKQSVLPSAASLALLQPPSQPIKSSTMDAHAAC